MHFDRVERAEGGRWCTYRLRGTRTRREQQKQRHGNTDNGNTSNNIHRSRRRKKLKSSRRRRRRGRRRIWRAGEGVYIMEEPWYRYSCCGACCPRSFQPQPGEGRSLGWKRARRGPSWALLLEHHRPRNLPQTLLAPQPCRPRRGSPRGLLPRGSAPATPPHCRPGTGAAAASRQSRQRWIAPDVTLEASAVARR